MFFPNKERINCGGDGWRNKKDKEISWIEFYNEILLQYGPDDLDDPMVALANLKQLGSVQECYKSFIGLAHLVDETEKNLISLFLAGLREDLRVKVKVTMPVTMVSAIEVLVLKR